MERADELSDLVRRNIQKSIALDALVVELRRWLCNSRARHVILRDIWRSSYCVASSLQRPGQYGSMFLAELLILRMAPAGSQMRLGLNGSSRTMERAVESGNRKLIRPSLNEVKDQMNRRPPTTTRRKPLRRIKPTRRISTT